MQDWDTRIKTLKANIENARNKWVIPHLNELKKDTNLKKSEETDPLQEVSNNVNDQKTTSTKVKLDPTEKLNELETIQNNQEKKELPEVEAKKVETEKEKPKVELPEVEAKKVETEKEKPKVELPEVEVNKNKKEEKQIRRKRKTKEVKPDFVSLELEKLEAINENDLSEDEEDRLMELRRIRTQRAMHLEDETNFQDEMKKADEEIKTLKSELKIKDKLPKGYIE